MTHGATLGALAVALRSIGRARQCGVEDVIMAAPIRRRDGGNIARQIALRAGCR